MIQSLRRVVATLVLFPLFSAAHAASHFNVQDEASFGLIGDLPYNDEQAAKFDVLIKEMNKQNLQFIVHTGDFKSGSSPCTDALLEQRFALFQTFVHPFVYLPGDNDWTDCHRAGGNPIERLEALRRVFYATETSLGRRTMPLERQSNIAMYQKFRENVRFDFRNVEFAALHVVGSSNGLDPLTPEGEAEYQERNAANLEWMKRSFARATDNNMRAVVLMMQANPSFEADAGSAERKGFDELITALEKETIAFKKPVYLIHGDSHYFRIDKPMWRMEGSTARMVENFTRIETFGSPTVHYLKASVTDDPWNVLDVNPVLIPGNIHKPIP